MPLAALPYGFKKRLIVLAPLSIVNNFSQIATLYAAGQKKTLLCSEFGSTYCHQFEYSRKANDGIHTIMPAWNSVLLVDEITDRGKKVYVDDTLILHCQIQGYDKIIPYIIGPYTRLVLHGRITWNQVQRLIHAGVKQVRINAGIQMPPTEYDDFVDFIVRHNRGPEYNFSFHIKNYYHMELITSLQNAFFNHEAYQLLNNGCNRQTSSLLAIFLYLSATGVAYTSQVLLFSIMKTCLTPKPEKMPLATLPYGFKKRLIVLAPLSIVNNFSRAYSEVEKFRPLLPDVRDDVYITDDHRVCRWAKKDSKMFRIWKYCHQFEYSRKANDGNHTIKPAWNSVLLVDEIIDHGKKIYVDDTLILHCQIQGYEKIIPYIMGPYTRLVLHGRITWNQVQRLIHAGVKQIRINARIQIQPAEYNDFVDFIVRHCRGPEYNFSFYSNNYYHVALFITLKNAYRNHGTHHIPNDGYDRKTIHVVYQRYRQDRVYYSCTIYFWHFTTSAIVFLLIALVCGEFPSLFFYKDMRNDFVPVIIVLILCIFLTIHGWIVIFAPVNILPLDIVSDDLLENGN
uniref:Recep_L_domain domain-containing protein n=1 Tax=Panagrellus redivivus TaxID=6233 RepID=A0A7E4V0Q5_PANRE